MPITWALRLKTPRSRPNIAMTNSRNSTQGSKPIFYSKKMPSEAELFGDLTGLLWDGGGADTASGRRIGDHGGIWSIVFLGFLPGFSDIPYQKLKERLTRRYIYPGNI